MGRARTAEAKQARREHILNAAVSLLDDQRYGEVTMASIASEAGLGKGTPYLYWRTKEELFLSALEQQYGMFLQALAEAIATAPPTLRGVAEVITGELIGRHRLMTLMGQLHVALEPNASVEAVIAFKIAAVEGGRAVAAVLAHRLPFLTVPKAAHLLVRIHGAAVALHQMANPPATVKAALERPELAILRTDLPSDLRELVLDLLLAARARARGEDG